MCLEELEEIITFATMIFSQCEIVSPGIWEAEIQRRVMAESVSERNNLSKQRHGGGEGDAANSVAVSCCVWMKMQSGLQCVTLAAVGTDAHSCLSKLGH